MVFEIILCYLCLIYLHQQTLRPSSSFKRYAKETNALGGKIGWRVNWNCDLAAGNEYFPRFRNFSSSGPAFFGALLNCISIAPLRTICSVFRCANIAQEPEPEAEQEAEPASALAPARAPAHAAAGHHLEEEQQQGRQQLPPESGAQ